MFGPCFGVQKVGEVIEGGREGGGQLKIITRASVKKMALRCISHEFHQHA